MTTRRKFLTTTGILAGLGIFGKLFGQKEETAKEHKAQSAAFMAYSLGTETEAHPELIKSLGGCYISAGEAEVTYYKNGESIIIKKNDKEVISDERLKEIISFLD